MFLLVAFVACGGLSRTAKCLRAARGALREWYLLLCWQVRRTRRWCRGVCARHRDGEPPSLETAAAGATPTRAHARSEKLRHRKIAAALKSEQRGQYTAATSAAACDPHAATMGMDASATAAAAVAAVAAAAKVTSELRAADSGPEGAREGAGALPQLMLRRARHECSACAEAATRAWASLQPRDPARSRSCEGLPPCALVFHPVYGVVPWEEIDRLDAGGNISDDDDGDDNGDDDASIDLR